MSLRHRAIAAASLTAMAFGETLKALVCAAVTAVAAAEVAHLAAPAPWVIAAAVFGFCLGRTAGHLEAISRWAGRR